MKQNKWILGILDKDATTCEKALKNVLRNFGHKCLLILDGFDETANDPNKDVMDILEDARLSKCSILLTSRPHESKTVEQRCQTVFSVNGFSREQATNFASKILKDAKKVHDILLFQYSQGFGWTYTPLHQFAVFFVRLGEGRELCPVKSEL